MKSVLQKEAECYICKKKMGLNDHHIFPGSFRKNSEKYGLKIWLCSHHHTGDEGIHNYPKMMLALKKIAQAHFERTHPREEFISAFGRNYLEE